MPISFIECYNQLPESIIVPKKIFGITYGYKEVTISSCLRKVMAVQYYQIYNIIEEELKQLNF